MINIKILKGSALNVREFRRRVVMAHPRLFRTAYAWTHQRDLADDLAQETIAKALARAKQLRDPDALESWLFKIMGNLWLDHIRRNDIVETSDDIDLETDESAETVNSRLETISQVRTAVKSLPDSYRQTIILVDIEGFSYTETAQILDIPVGTVMSRLSRARKQLKKQLLTHRLAISQMWRTK